MTGPQDPRLARSLAELEPRPSAVTIGFFDGMHRGHQTLIRHTIAAARTERLRSVAVTFDRDPRTVVRPGSQPRLLMTHERRLRALLEQGSHLVLVLPFTRSLSRLKPETFVEQVLVEALQARVVVVGRNFRFGYEAAGSVATLTELGAVHGFRVLPQELLELDGALISSSAIRARLAAGEVEWAAEALGRPHRLDGSVVVGEGRGRSLGVPTANIDVAPGLVVPAAGVYAGHVELASGQHLPAVTNVGVRPTFGGETLTVEAHLLDADLDLYGQHLGVGFRHRLRDERRFDTVEALVEQIHRDIERGRTLLGVPPG